MGIEPSKAAATLRRCAVGAALGLATFIVGTLATLWIAAYSEEHHWFAHPSDQLAAVMSFLAAVLGNAWFHWIGGAVFGFAVGVWLDAFLRKKAANESLMEGQRPTHDGSEDGARAKLTVRVSDREPYAFSQEQSVFRRFGIFNEGPIAAENVNVQLRAIRPKPSMTAGALDLPLSAWTSGGPDPLTLKILSKDEVLCTVFDAHPDRVDTSPSARWQANNLGRGHTFMPSIFLENEGRWEFDYVIQSSNAEDIPFTLVVRANANGIIVEKKS